MRKWIVVMAAAVTAVGCIPEHAVEPTSDVALRMAKPVRPPPSGIVATQLPLLTGGNSGIAYANNDAEEIVGQSSSPGGTYPVRWTRTVAGGWQVQAMGSTSGYAREINELGTAVGTSGGNVVIWPRVGAPEIVGAGEAFGINGSDVVIGLRSDVTPHRATAWTRSPSSPSVWIAHDLPPVAGAIHAGLPDSWPEAIGEDGIIVGGSNTRDVPQRAIMWTPDGSGGWNQAVVIPGSPETTSSTSAGAITGSDAVGSATVCSGSTCVRRAWHWSVSPSGSGVGQIGDGSDAYADGVNSTRMIVGFFHTRKGAKITQNAFVWSPSNPTMTVMGNGWAHDVNNATASRTVKQAVGENLEKPMLWTIP